MGVEVRLFIIPRGATTRPSPAQLARFVAALIEGRWLVDPHQVGMHKMPGWSRAAEFAATTGAAVTAKSRDNVRPFDVARAGEAFAALAGTDAKVSWPVLDDGTAARLRYPLDVEMPAGEEYYYDLELWLADDYVYVTSEGIDPFVKTACVCGEVLEYEVEGDVDSVFYSSRLRVRCAKCNAMHDVRRRTAVVRDFLTDGEREAPGGASFSCALVIDLGKCWPREGTFQAHPDLVAVVERTLGGPVAVLIDAY
jgi:hypothetical protein